MPGPATHIAFVDKYLRSNSVENLNDFILGTIFPDVRYLARLEREKTHKRFGPDMDLSQLDSFERGWKLHIYLDDQWGRAVLVSDFYAKYKAEALIFLTAGKIIEDSIDRKRIGDIAEYSAIIKSSDFKTVLDLPKETMQLYFDVVAEYLLTNDFKAYAEAIFNEDEGTLDKIFDGVERIKKDNKDIDFLSGILDNIAP